MKYLFFLGAILLLGVEVDAQYTVLKGKIVDYENNAVKGVEIYIDMKRTKAASNSRGKYSYKHPRTFQLVTIYAPKYGFINWKYQGEKKIDFAFPKDSEPMKREDFAALGYSTTVPSKESEENFYANYSSVLEILNHRFPEVKVQGGQIFISRRGVNSALVQDPLILVNQIPTNIGTLETIPTADVKSIRVITKGSEAAEYGFRGMNGVILVQLKTSKDGN